MLKLILKEWDMRGWIGLSRLRTGFSRSCEHGNEISGSIKDREYL